LRFISLVGVRTLVGKISRTFVVIISFYSKFPTSCLIVLTFTRCFHVSMTLRNPYLHCAVTNLISFSHYLSWLLLYTSMHNSQEHILLIFLQFFQQRGPRTILCTVHDVSFLFSWQAIANHFWPALNPLSINTELSSN
jgi:hypothetical protein